MYLLDCNESCRCVEQDAARHGHQSRAAGTAVTMLTIPGFTHPVRDFHLEDVLELTGFKISRGSR